MWKDITMPLHHTLAVWPGDTPYRYRRDASLQHDGANVGSIEMSLHAGTHVDAPYHYDDFGASIDSLPLELFMGAVDIFDASQLAQKLTEPLCERVFIKTRTNYKLHVFDEEYEPLTVPAIRALAAKGVRVIGTDACSVDAFSDAHLPVHAACNEANMYIIENLYLKDVDAGRYEFIGLPLAIQGGDASPIRAIIRKVRESI